jgi:hypothetical protein
VTDQFAAVVEPWRGALRSGSSTVSVHGVLHPVGPLSPAVYWRRRALLLGLLLAVLVGGGWLTVAAVRGSTGSTAAAPPAGQATGTPSLEQVVPSLAAVQVPTVAPASPSQAATQATSSGSAAPVAGPTIVPGVPCTDDMISVAVRAGASSVAVGSKPTLELVVTNTSPVACVRAVDKGLQEIVLLETGGARVWGSNDCFPEANSDTRTLAAGQAVVFPVVWGGLSSEPTCTAPRKPPAPGSYVLRGRLDTKLSSDTPLTLT